MIGKEEREEDKAVLATATARPWIAVSPRSQDGGPQLASFGPALRIDPIVHAVSLRAGKTMSLGDAVTAQHAMTEEQHVANCRAAAHAVNRLPAYIADAEETERRIAKIEAWHRATTNPEHGDPDENTEGTLALVLKILRGKPLTADTLSRVVALVRDVYGTEQPVAADTALDEDSIGLAILAMSVEREFGVALPWRTEWAWRTVADIVAAVEKARCV